jgi:hypothetical protein
MSLSVHVVVGADVEEDHADGVEDKDDAVLAREPRCEALGERPFETVGAQRRCARVLGDELDDGLFVSAWSSGWRRMKAVSRLSNLLVVKISLMPT